MVEHDDVGRSADHQPPEVRPAGHWRGSRGGGPHARRHGLLRPMGAAVQRYER